MTLRFVFTNCFRSCTSQNNYDLNVFFDLSSNSCSPWKCSLAKMNGSTTMFGFLSRVVLTTNSLFRFLLHQGQIIHTSVIWHILWSHSSALKMKLEKYIIVHFRKWTCFSGNLILRNGFEMGGLVECLRWPSNMFSGNLSNFITKICRQAGVALMMRLKKIHKCSLFKKGIVWWEVNEPSD